MTLPSERIETIAIMTLMYGEADTIASDALLSECSALGLDVDLATVQMRLDHLVKCRYLEYSDGTYRIDAGDEIGRCDL